jgi:hypothetical protein
VVVSRTTGYQAKVKTNRGLMVVPSNGRIVAWTVALSKPSAAQIKYFETTKGFGPAQAGLAILRVGKYVKHTLKASGPLVNLTPYFGGVAQFPLATSIPVRKGDLVAVTVPSWAPMLQAGVGGDTSWRGSRPRNKCKDYDTQTAHVKVGETVQYFCLYRTARLSYSATLVTNPVQTNKAKTKSKKSARDSR